MKKRLLVIGINCLPELTGIGKYTGEMVLWMADNGHAVTVITGFPYYPEWKIQKPYSGRFYRKEILFNGSLAMYRCPMYVPQRPTGLRRLIQELTFFTSASFVIARLLFKRKHQLIFSVSPPFHLGFLAFFYRFFKGGKIIYHIQDLQIEAAKNLRMLKPSWLFPVMFGLEKFILDHANFVSTISSGMMTHVQRKTAKEILLFPNWADTVGLYPVINRSYLKSAWGFKPEDHIVLYSGSIGEKQGLDVLIRIAEHSKKENTIQFVICGTGPYKQKLSEEASKKGLQNIHFLPLQQNNMFNDFLNMADVHLVLQRKDASDLVMPSKLNAILSVGGLVLVTADAGTSLYNIIKDHDIGIIVQAEDEEALQEQIYLCCRNDYSVYRQNARRYAEQYLNKESILKEVLSNVNK